MTHGGHVSAVVLAGGRGTRMGDLTDNRPKPLLEVGGRPLIAYQLRRLAALGIIDVVIATGYLGEAFPKALGDGSDYGLRLRFSQETEPLDTGGGVALALHERGNTRSDTVVVLNGDLLSSHDLARQIDAFTVRRSRGHVLATLHARHVDDVRPFGLLEIGDDGRITSFREKTTRPIAGTVNAGTYVLDPSLLDDVRPGRAVSLEREVFPAALAAGYLLTAYREDSPFLDVGTPEALRAAQTSPLVDREG